MTVPVVLVVAFLVGGGSGDDGPDVTPGVLNTSVPAPAADVEKQCAPLLDALPPNLPGESGAPQLPSLAVSPGGPTFRAWGTGEPDAPLVTLQCGVERPATLRSDVAYDPLTVGPTSDPGATFIAVNDGDRTTWTTVDRAVYIRIVVPTGEVGALVSLSQLIAQKYPAVCKTSPEAGDPDSTVYCGSRP